jgi:hypothetical protein
MNKISQSVLAVGLISACLPVFAGNSCHIISLHVENYTPYPIQVFVSPTEGDVGTKLTVIPGRTPTAVDYASIKISYSRKDKAKGTITINNIAFKYNMDGSGSVCSNTSESGEKASGTLTVVSKPASGSNASNSYIAQTEDSPYIPPDIIQPAK